MIPMNNAINKYALIVPSFNMNIPDNNIMPEIIQNRISSIIVTKSGVTYTCLNILKKSNKKLITIPNKIKIRNMLNSFPII